MFRRNKGSLKNSLNLRTNGEDMSESSQEMVANFSGIWNSKEREILQEILEKNSLDKPTKTPFKTLMCYKTSEKSDENNETRFKASSAQSNEDVALQKNVFKGFVTNIFHRKEKNTGRDKVKAFPKNGFMSFEV